MVNAGEEACQVLVDQNEVSINRCFAQNGQQCVHVPCGEVVGTGGWDELKDKPSKDVEHRPKGRFHEGDDGSTTLKVLLSFCQNITSWQLSAGADCPGIGFAMLSMERFDQ